MHLSRARLPNVSERKMRTFYLRSTLHSDRDHPGGNGKLLKGMGVRLRPAQVHEGVAIPRTSLGVS